MAGGALEERHDLGPGDLAKEVDGLGCSPDDEDEGDEGECPEAGGVFTAGLIFVEGLDDPTGGSPVTSVDIWVPRCWSRRGRGWSLGGLSAGAVRG